MTKRGGPWTRREDVLAYSLYASRGVADDHDPAVIELSGLTGRSVGAVVRKLANFLAVETGGLKGLKHFGATDKEVYRKFRGRPAALAAEVRRARDDFLSKAAASRKPFRTTKLFTPKWAFQAREFTRGRRYYPLGEELPRVLKRRPSERVVHWESAEHRYTPFLMQEGDLVLLFQGGTRDYLARGFYGYASIVNLDGRCAAPVHERGRHDGNNLHNRPVGVDLTYLGAFREPVLPPVLGSPLTNKNLHKLIAGGRGGSSQETVFSISERDWSRISSRFSFGGASLRKSPGRRANRNGRGGWAPVDPVRKAKIEAAAVKLSRARFEDLGYEVTSVERDDKGWDLEASKNEVTLRLEVKGLSGPDVSIELTPNEYKHIKTRSHEYRICVVTEALKRPTLCVYSYSERSGRWQDEAGDSLSVSEITGARMFKP